MKDAGKSIEVGDQSMIEMGQSVEASIDIPNTAAEFESPIKLRDNLEEQQEESKKQKPANEEEQKVEDDDAAIKRSMSSTQRSIEK